MNLKILIVEDEAVFAMELEELLDQMGYSTTKVVSSGEAALRKIERQPPDLVLMDIKLSGRIDGIETAEEIHEYLDIPIIYVTAYSDHMTMQRAIATQPFSYLSKPLDEERFRSVIDAVARRLRKSDNGAVYQSSW